MKEPRRSLAATLCAHALVFALPLAASGQDRGRVWRVGFLSPRRHLIPPEADYYDQFSRGMEELAYVDGKNLKIEWRYAEGDYARLPALAAQLVKLPVDVIIADGTAAVQAAQGATRSIPIVFPSAGDPVGNGLVKSLAHPGGNTTGISLLAGESVVNKQLEILRTILPRVSRIAVIYNPDNAFGRMVLSSLRTMEPEPGVQIVAIATRSAQEIEGGFERIRKERADAFVWIADAVISQQKCQIADLAARDRVPGMGQGPGYPQCGGLISYGSNNFDNYRRAAKFVDKILRGAKAGDLPVEQPTKFELVVNKKTAKALGLTIPPEVLVQADQVIE